MRLIDADALAKFIDYGHLNNPNEKLYSENDIREMIDMMPTQPTIDAVPVIRCKDCKHYYEKEWVVGGGSYTTCWYQTIANAQPNDFCSRAERKEE